MLSLASRLNDDAWTKSRFRRALFWTKCTGVMPPVDESSTSMHWSVGAFGFGKVGHESVAPVK